MKILLYIPIVLSLIVLGAHFLRYGNLLLVVAALGLVALLAVRRWWAARVIQVVLVLGALEWGRTLALLVMRRSAAGEPLARMAVILGAVAAITLASALLFETSTLKRIYGASDEAT